MGGSFILASLVPIAPYFFMGGDAGIGASAAAALASLFALGMVKSRLLQRSPLVQAAEILLIGAAAAALGFGLGELIPRLFN